MSFFQKNRCKTPPFPRKTRHQNLPGPGVLPLILIFFLILLQFLLLLPPKVEGAGKKVVVISADRLSLPTLVEGASRLPHLKALLEDGGLGLMNVATGGGLSSENAYATLGAGTRALGGNKAGLAFHREEKYYQDPAPLVFQRHYGYPPAEEILYLGLAETRRVNLARPYRVVPGALGQALAEAGKERALLGNSDTQAPRRQSALFLTDTRGDVGSGRVDTQVLTEDPCHPFGHRLTARELFPLFQETCAAADLLLVDWGDFYRLEEYQAYLTPERQAELLEENLEELDEFLGLVLGELGPGSLLILLAPTPPRQDWGTGSMMSPVVILEPGSGRGLLTSATTRRRGIIANLDIPATILDHLEVEQPPYMLGHPALTLPVASGGDYLGRRLVEMARVYDQRPPVIQAYVSFQVLIVLAALAGVLLRIKGALALRPLMLSLMLVPLLLLLFPLLPPWPLPLTLVAAYGGAFLLGYLLYRFLSFRVALPAIALATSLALSLDIWAGSPLIQRSFLGFDPVAGARYYGVGNEYMGALVGSTLLFGTAALQFFPSARKRAAFPLLLYYLGVVILLAMPVLGANFGGTLTALAAGLVTGVSLYWRKRDYTHILLGLLTVVALLGVFMWLNFPAPGREISHWGRSMEAVARGGLPEVLDILTRKASMGMRLLRYSYWSRVFISFLLAQAVLLFRPMGVLKEMQQRYPFFMSGVIGITFGALAAILTNDSGVVAAAMALLYGTIPLLYLVLGKVHREDEA